MKVHQNVIGGHKYIEVGAYFIDVPRHEFEKSETELRNILFRLDTLVSVSDNGFIEDGKEYGCEITLINGESYVINASMKRIIQELTN